MAVSKVAPPHISKENISGVRVEYAPAIFSMSCVRMRVAMSDWWASRRVVSVIKEAFLV